MRQEGYLRCSCCNRTSSGEIAEFDGDVYHGRFYLERREDKLYCSECMEWHVEITTGYAIDDEIVLSEEDINMAKRKKHVDIISGTRGKRLR